MAVTLSQFFGTHTGDLKIYVGPFEVGKGSFISFSNTVAKFSGSYNAFGSRGIFAIAIEFLNAQPGLSGTCKVTMNDRVDGSSTYQVQGSKLTLKTALNDTPVNVYVNQGGTQIDGVSGHNLWIGQWS